MAAAPPGKTPKVMSSRLMTMKFMQRAVASSPSSAPLTPDQPSNKKRKLSDSTGPDSPLSDFQRIQAALAEEEAKRQKALEKQGAEVGETKWVLSFQNKQNGNGATAHNGLRVVRAGYASLDSSAGRSVERAYPEDETWRPPTVGRKIFGQFKSASTHSPKDAGTSSSSDEEVERESDGDGEPDPTGATALINEASKEATLRAKDGRRAKRKAEKAESKRLADERRSRKVKLNELTSISGGGTGSSVDYLAQMQCHQCGGKGHKARDCPTSDVKKKKRSRKEERREVS